MIDIPPFKRIINIWIIIIILFAILPLIAGVIKAISTNQSLLEVFAYYHWFFVITIPISILFTLLTYIIIFLKFR